MLQMTLQKKATSTVSIEVHKSAIFDNLKKKYLIQHKISTFIPKIRNKKFSTM
jgi:hypothetical protein